jgi:hypothetical protein
VQMWRVPGVLPVAIWKVFFFSNTCVDLSTLVGWVCFLLFIQWWGAKKWVVSWRLVSLAISDCWMILWLQVQSKLSDSFLKKRSKALYST